MDFTIDPKEAYSLVDKVANSICAKCGMRKSFVGGKRAFILLIMPLFNMVSVLEEKKALSENNIPISIRDYCINKEKLIGGENK